MADWQVTAATIHCDGVADDVTIIVHPDWSTRCTGREKYTATREASLNLVKRSLELHLPLHCPPEDCPRVTEYILKLKSEEASRTIPPDRPH